MTALEAAERIVDNNISLIENKLLDRKFIFDEEFKENFGRVVGREIPDLIEKKCKLPVGCLIRSEIEVYGEYRGVIYFVDFGGDLNFLKEVMETTLF